jgi:hypothetical protein
MVLNNYNDADVINTTSLPSFFYARTVVETGSHKHKGAVEDLDKVVLSGLRH